MYLSAASMTTAMPASNQNVDLKGPYVDYIESDAVGRNSANPKSKGDPRSLTNIETIALVVDRPKADFKLETIFLDEIRGDELLIDMKYSGICHTVQLFILASH